MAETMGEGTDSRRTNVRRGRATILPGTPMEREIETGEHVVAAAGVPRYVGSSWSALGCDDADRLRALSQGKPEPEPHWKKVARFQEKEIARQAAKKNNGEAPVAAAKPSGPKTPEQILADRLAAFPGDEEMQDLVFERWKAEFRGAAVPVASAPVA